MSPFCGWSEMLILCHQLEAALGLGVPSGKGLFLLSVGWKAFPRRCALLEGSGRAQPPLPLGHQTSGVSLSPTCCRAVIKPEVTLSRSVIGTLGADEGESGGLQT